MAGELPHRQSSSGNENVQVMGDYNVVNVQYSRSSSSYDFVPRTLRAVPPVTSSQVIEQRVLLVKTIYTQLTQLNLSALALTGIGGVGKSTLAALVHDYAEQQRKDNVGPFTASTLWFSIDGTATFSDLAYTIYKELGESLPDDFFKSAPANQALVLFNLLAETKKPRLIVLDQFENFLNWETGQVLSKHPEVGEWLDALNGHLLQTGCRLLLTSRPLPKSVHESPQAYMQNYPVRGLKPPEGVIWLRSRGIRAGEPDLERVVNSCNGHMLALSLFVAAASYYPIKELLAKPEIFWQNDIEKKLLNEIFANLDEYELGLLHSFSYYQNAVPLDIVLKTMQLVMQKKEVKEEQAFQALKAVYDQGLIQREGDEYQLHVIIADYVQSHFGKQANLIAEESDKQTDLHKIEKEAQGIAQISAITYLIRSKYDRKILNVNRQRFLDRVRAFWIDGVLEHSLHGAAPIALGLELQETNWSLRPLPTVTSIVQAYDESDGELLILGEAGSGKTTLLLELAGELLARAHQDETAPIPAVLDLSSWVATRKPLATWLITELQTRYQVPRSLATSWINAGLVLPLLDGLDEVSAEHREACVEAINTYRQEHGLVSTVVCSRTEYLKLPTRLQLRAAVVVQPLTPQQIDDYLVSAGWQLKAKHLAALREDARLREMMKNPLLLRVVTFIYQREPVEDLLTAGSSETLRRRLFEQYVKRMLTRYTPTRYTPTRYTPEQITHWLSNLARRMKQQNQTVFYIEEIQPDWLPSIGAHRLYRGITTVILAMLFFGTAGLLVGALPGLGLGLVAGGLIGTLNDALNLILRFTWRKTWSWLRLLVKCCCFGLVGGLAFALLTRLAVGQFHGQDLGSINGPIFGVIAAVFGLLFDRLVGAPDMNIKLADVVVWSWKRMAQPLVLLLCLGLAGGLILGPFFRYVLSWITIIILGLCCGLILGLFFGLIRGWSSRTVENEYRTSPNQGIWRSARNGLRTGLRAGAVVGLILGLFVGSIAVMDITPGAGIPIPGWLAAILLGLYYVLSSGLFTGFVVGLFDGWDAWIKHFVLRFLLSRSGYLPWSLPSFLDYAAQRIFLRKVGGGYIFVHRQLLEYFANLEVGPGDTPT